MPDSSLQPIFEFLAGAFELPLPGEAAQFKMAPYKRPTAAQALKLDITPRLSAVMVLVYALNNAPHFILTRRPSYQGVHSNQVSLPGGKKEEEDADLEATALRETCEEIGVPGDRIQVVGALTQVFIPPSGFLVQPYVGIAQGELEFDPDPREVQSLIEVPIGQLMDDQLVKENTVKAMNGTVSLKAPYFDLLGNQVWGATAMILSEFKHLLHRMN
ncbi:MAG: NUDIX hydrolase [Salibacteraceae bacterium]